MTAYAKTALGEKLTYRPLDLDRYAGEQFCLRITPEDIELDRCFFVYLDERFEHSSIGSLFQNYFFAPGAAEEAEMASWLDRWLYMDPTLRKKYVLLQQMIAKVHEQGGKVLYYINHGPGPIDPNDLVRRHLGTSVFSDGSFDDKILDVVIVFNAEEEPRAELSQWRRFRPIDTTVAKGSGASPTRRSALGSCLVALIAIFSLPFLLYSCRQNQNNNGFGGGML